MNEVIYPREENRNRQSSERQVKAKNMEREGGWVVSKHETHPVSVRRGTKDVPGSKTTDQLVLSKVSSIKNKNTTPQKTKPNKNNNKNELGWGKGVLSESNQLS